MHSWNRYILLGLCLGFLGLFLVAPLVLAIQGGFVDNGHFTLEWLGKLLPDLSAPAGEHLSAGQILDRLANDPLVNAVKVAVLVTAGVMLLAVPLALLTNHFDFRGKNLASALLMVPMILPPFVGAIALRKLLAHYDGPVNVLLGSVGLPRVDWFGGGPLLAVVVMEILHLYPIMYLNASAALANVDPTMVQAARNLGASRWRTFWTVTLPLIRPGLFAGGAIVFIWSFTELGTPLMFGYTQILPVQAFNGLNQLEQTPKPYAMVFLMLSASLALYGMSKFLFGRGGGAMVGRGTAAITRPASRPVAALIWAAILAVALLAAVPHVGVLLMAVAGRWEGTVLPTSYTLDHLRQVFTNPDNWNSILNSLHYASFATVVAILLGLAISFLVVRAKVRGGWLLDSLAMLPLAVPGIVIAGGYVLMAQWHWPQKAGAWVSGLGLESLGGWLADQRPTVDPVLILIVAYSIRRLPYMVRSVSAGLEQTSETLEEAARNLGAGRARTLVRVTLPLVMANVLAGAILTFSFSMLEVSDSLILAQTSDYYPITKQIYSLANMGPQMENSAAALGALAMLLLVATLVAANLLLGKRLGALFRV